MNLQESYLRCETQLIKQTGKAGSKLIAKDLRPHAAAIAAFVSELNCRSMREITPAGSEEAFARSRELTRFSLALEAGLSARASPATDEHWFLPALQNTLRARELPPTLLFDLIDAAQVELGAFQFEDDAALTAYATKAACPFGQLLLRLQDVVSSAALAEIDHVSLAYRYACFLRDLHADLPNRRLFFSRTQIEGCGLDEQCLLKQECAESLQPLLQQHILTARGHLEKSKPLVSRLIGMPRKQVVFVRLSTEVLLNHIQKEAPAALLAKRPQIPALQQAQILTKALLA